MDNQIQVFEMFGKHNYSTIKHLNSSLIHPLLANENDTTCTNLLFQMCRDLINNNGNNVNLIVFSSVLKKLVNTSPKMITGLLCQIFADETVKLYNNVQQSFDNNSFTIDKFFDDYQKFYSNTQTVVNVMSDFSKKVQSDNRYNFVNLIRSYTFYNNVIKARYNYNSKHMQFLQIIKHIIETEKININTLKPLIKLNRYYIRLSYVVKEQRNTLFDIDVDTKFLSSFGSNLDFSKMLAIEIHKLIVEMSKNGESKEIYLSMEDIFNMVNSFDEKTLFIAFYKRLLENRLLYTSYNLQIEKKCVEMLNSEKDRALIQMIVFILNDIEDSLTYTDAFRKIKFAATSNRFKGVDMKNINREKVNVVLMRYGSWTDSTVKEIDVINLPNDAAVYTNIFETLYCKHRRPYHKIFWNYNLGTAVVGVKLGEKEYDIKMTTPQMILISQFANNEKITVVDLCKKTGITPAKIGQLLNSFLKHKILTRDEKEQNNNVNMEIFLNHNFTYPDSSFSLLTEFENSVSQTQVPQKKEIDFDAGRKSVVLASVQRILKNKSVSKKDILNKIKTSIPFPVTPDMLEIVLKTGQDQNVLTVNNDTVSKVQNIQTINKEMSDNEESFSDEE